MLAGGMFGISGYDALGDDWYHDNLFISGHKFECERKRNSNEAKCEKLYKLASGAGWDAIKKGLPALVVEKAEAMFAKHDNWPDKSRIMVYPRSGIGLADVQSDNRLWLIWDPDAPPGGGRPLTQIKSVGIVVRKKTDTGFLSTIGTTFGMLPKVPGYIVQIGAAVVNTAFDTFRKALDTVLNNACPAAKSPIGQMGTAMLAVANPSVALMQTQAQAIIGRLCPDPAPPPPPASNPWLPFLIVGGAVAAALVLTSSPSRSAAPTTPPKKKA